MTMKGISRELIGARVAQEIRPGRYVNLGIGLPTLAAKFAPADVTFQAEDGLWGYGRPANEEERDRDRINAGGQ